MFDCRPTGSRRSSTAGSMGCTWPASTARRSSGSSEITSRASVSPSRKSDRNIGFLISCSLTFQPIISISQCNVFLQWQHGHWTLIFPVALSLSSLAPGIVCHQASRVSHYYSVLFPQKNASSAISFLLKICGPSPPPAQLPTTPCRPGSEDWILNISSDPFHSPVSRCPVVSVSCYLLSQSLSQDNRKRKVWTDFLLAD